MTRHCAAVTTIGQKYSGCGSSDALKVLSEREFFISEERIMTIIRRKSREGTDYNLKPVPKVKAPRLTAAQLELFPVR